MGRLLIVSNRLPVSATKRANNIRFQPSAGGLATGLASLHKSKQGRWIGWPGITAEKISEQQKQQISGQLEAENYRPVFLSEKMIENYYYGFCNKTIWPLFHYFPLHTVMENRFWDAYKKVNQTFCRAVVEIAEPDDCIWVQDYQLMLLPLLIREKLPEAQIGFFLHIPFPSFELFRFLVWRAEILNGLLGADLVGFHTYDYVRHFLSSVSRIVGYDHTLGQLTLGNRIVKVDAFPMGIDYEKYSNAVHRPQVRKEITRIKNKVGDRKIIISIDRLDYTKGIKQRLEAFDIFLSRNPEYKGKVTLVLVAVPSRTRVTDYIMLRKELEGLVGRVNGEHGVLGWMPVWYLYRFIPFNKLTALYNIADVALVTPIRDGMNLIAKEFVATKGDSGGVLVLSEMTGAARELGEAVIVNANNKEEIVEAIKQALEMPEEEQTERNRLMQKRLSRYTVARWADDFMASLGDIKKTQQQLSVRKLAEPQRKMLTRDYRRSQRRLLLLDYDGTLVDFVGRPEKAGPDSELLELLSGLAKDLKNEVVIISGRDKSTLNRWFSDLNVASIAEHGAWIKEKDKDWEVTEPLKSDWKDAIRPILELYVDRTPGSSIEEKDFSLVWHCRRADPELAYVRTQELRAAVVNLTENLDVGVFEGSKILEIKNFGVNKGRPAELWLAKRNWDFILSVGDDYTDEDMFAVMPEQAYSIRVGYSISKARFNVYSVYELRLLLKELVRG